MKTVTTPSRQSSARLRCRHVPFAFPRSLIARASLVAQVARDGEYQQDQRDDADEAHAELHAADVARDDHTGEERRRDRREDEREAHVGTAAALCAFDRLGAQRLGHCAHLTTGGVSNVWYGAGDGSVHSSVVAPSHGLPGAFSPLCAMHFRTTYRKMNCDRPNQNAPTVDTMFQSVNCCE